MITVNVAVVAPALTVTLAGTRAAAVLLLESATTVPPVGAILLSVTLPVDDVPPTTLLGLRVTEASDGGFTVSVPVLLKPAYVPVIVTERTDDTAVVVTVNVAVVAPPATVTLAGTCAALVSLLDRLTAAPVDGAAELSVTVPVELTPPCTLAGFNVTDAMPGGVTVNVVLTVPFRVALMLTCVEVPTGTVVRLNVAVEEFAATVTFAGTEASELLLLLKVTVVDDVAGAVKVTVPLEELPPATDAGFAATD